MVTNLLTLCILLYFRGLCTEEYSEHERLIIMNDKNYDQTLTVFKEIDGVKRKIEWKIKGKELTRISYFETCDTKITRVFNFNTQRVTRECHNLKKGNECFDSYDKPIDEVRDNAPNLFLGAVNQYIAFQHQ